MAIKRYSKADIDKVSAISIYDYIRDQGIGRIYNDGGKYVKVNIDGHDSIVIDTAKNYFIHNANSGEKNASGNIINFVQYINHNEMGFREAMAHLIEYSEGREIDWTKQKIKPIEQEPFSYTYELANNTLELKNYLGNERGISQETIDYLLDNQYIIQDKYNNVIFNWTRGGKPPSEREDIIGATQVVTDKDRIKQRGISKYIGKNSEKNYGFNIHLGDRVETLYVFEADIDLISYLDMHQNLTNAHLISMGGVKEETFLAFVEEDYQKNSDGFDVCYCVDNDMAGHAFLDKNAFAYNSHPKIQTYYLIPDFDSIEKKEWQELKQVCQKYTVPLEYAFPVYQYERPFIDQELANKELYFEQGISKGIEQLQQDINNRKFEDFIDSREYSISEKDRIYHWKNAIDTHSIQIVDEVIKDYNDLLKEKNKSRHDKKEEKVHERILKEAQRISEDRIDYLAQKYHIDKEILNILGRKGFIREKITTKEPLFICSENKRLTGAVFENQTLMNPTDINRRNFVITIGEPQNILLFDSPQESLQYWSLYKHELNDSVLISLNHSHNSQDKVTQINRIMNENHQTEFTYCSKGYVDYNKLNGYLNRVSPLGETWKEDLLKVKEYKTNREKVQSINHELDRETNEPKPDYDLAKGKLFVVI
ncbi:hypothetical protein CL176_05650 [Suicoccus acidiformans]|uniref:DUF3991 domain-containing protein n=1 Tax=Suicoccus acidiformans TaxID=2036206 RepID=A0A347WKB1_9LACT|nr:DUF3991 domain-containing protein [Suicoccus acidiformans]AXY25518.1 hypothetical protein CL176_05650 [Suicoccus acidiformans]